MEKSPTQALRTQRDRTFQGLCWPSAPACTGSELHHGHLALPD